MELSNRVVLLTGAKRIGAEVAKAVSARGADVVLIYNKSQAEADEAASTVREAGRRALVVQADVSDAKAAPRIMEQIEREFGRLDVLVNMASMYHSQPFDEVTHADWQKQLSVDLGGSFLVSRAAVPLMRKHGGGRIINFTDWVAASGRP